MSSPLSECRDGLGQCLALGLLVAVGGCCDSRAPLQNGLASFSVTAQDESGQLGNFPTIPVKIHVTADALDAYGNPDPSFSGTAYSYVTPGNVMQNEFTTATSPAQEPTLSFSNGHAEGDIWAFHVFGATSVWVENRPAGGADGGPPPGNYATGVSDPSLAYGYPLLSDLQITNDNTKSPLNGNYVIVDQSQPRCLVQPADGGVCDPAQLYTMDLLVTAVESDGFYVMDRNAYDVDAGVPKPGWDPNTERFDLPGTWGYLFVYTYGAPNLFPGNRIVALSGSIQEFVADTQMSFPSWTLNPDPIYLNPRPQDIPPPVPVDPAWCSIGTPGDHLSDQYLCAPGTDNLQFESLESGLVKATNVTLPSLWQNCDLSGTGKVPYRTTQGCMPQTSGTFCGEPGARQSCPAGQDCVANECTARCEQSSDCNAADHEACLSGHCMNPCLCREWCNSQLDCSEQSAFAGYGQYDGYVPGQPGHAPWKLSFVTRTGVPSLVPQLHPGMVIDVTGLMNQVRASDPMWEVVPRSEEDVCCHPDSPGCDGDAGVPICPKPLAQ